MFKKYILSLVAMFMAAVTLCLSVFSENRIELAVGILLTSFLFSTGLILALNEKVNGEKS